jgi:2-iminobutanoate/2-iminopropanoate deaminase
MIIMKREVVVPWEMHAEHRTPYVPAIKVKGGTMLFMSGMGPHKPDHKHPHVPEEWVLPENAAAQARMVLDKMKRIVEAAGGKFEHIVKITRYFKNIADQDAVNELIHEYWGTNLPCSTTVQVAGFVVPTMLIEIDGWAVIPDSES